MHLRRRIWKPRYDVWSCLGCLEWLALIVFVIRHGADAGITFDEQLQREYGDLVLAWYRSGFHDGGALTQRNLYLYGGLFDAAAQWLAERSPLGVFETRHRLTACIAALALIPTWKLAALFGGRRAGFLASCILATTPLWIGHGLFNPKDIPFGTAATFALWACLRVVVAPRRAWRARTRLAAIPTGIALGIRPGAPFLLVYISLAAVLRAYLSEDKASSPARRARLRRAVRQAGPHVLAAIGIAWLLMLSAWPWAQLSPIVRPLQAMAAASRFGFHGRVLFDGAIVSARALPPHYLPLWLLITLPEIYAVGLLAGLFLLQARAEQLAQQRRLVFAFALLALSIVMPLFAVVVMRSVVYDAQRHVLFIIPPLAALAGVALCALADVLAARSLALRNAMAVVVAVSVGLTLVDMVELHPYEYVYFNRAFGGLRAAFGRFDTDYWGASYYEGLEWLVAHASEQPHTPLRVGWCTAWIPLDYYLTRWPDAGERFTLAARVDSPDYFLASTRHSCRPPVGRVVHTISRDHVPLLYVLQTRP